MTQHHTAENNKVTIHFGGPGFGEGILVSIGDRILLGIDCPKSFILNPDATGSFLDKQIRLLQGEKQIYWLLTHYHLDHFQLLDAVLERYSDLITSFVHPADYTAEDFRYLMGESTRSAGYKKSEAIKARSAYVRLREQMSREAVRAISRTITSPGETWISMTLRTKNVGLKKLRVSVFSPPPAMMEKIMGSELKRLMSGDTRKQHSRSIANYSSYIVFLSFGNFEALFLNDAPLSRTENVNWKEVGINRGLSLLKVANHGSLNGTSPQLLESLEGKEYVEGRKAIIAPNRHHGFPQEEVIKMLKNAGYEVLVSGQKRASKREKEALELESREMGVKINVFDAHRSGDDIITLEFEA